MSVIRLPPWSEVLRPRAPWAYVLRSGGAGLWLMRGEAEHVTGLDVRIVAGTACRTTEELFDEWTAALECPDRCERSWDGFADCVSDLEWLSPACAVLVSDAERLLELEPARLPTLLDTLRRAASAFAARGRTLRLVFQSRFDSRPERLAVFHEFDAADIV